MTPIVLVGNLVADCAGLPRGGAAAGGGGVMGPTSDPGGCGRLANPRKNTVLTKILVKIPGGGMAGKVGLGEMAGILGIPPSTLAGAARTGRVPSKRDVNDKLRFDVEAVKRAWNLSAPLADQHDRRDVRRKRGRPPKNGGVPQGVSMFPPIGGPPGKGGENAAPQNLSDDEEGDRVKLLKAKAEQAVANAHLSELKLQEKRGELISRDQARKEGEELGAILLSQLQSWPARMAPLLAGMRDADEFEFHNFLTKEINELIITIRVKLEID